MSSNCYCTFSFTVNRKNPCGIGCDNDGADVEFSDINDFVKFVTVNVKDKDGLAIPDGMALTYLTMAAQKFIEETRISQRRLEFIAECGVKDYYIEDGEYEQIHEVTSLKYHDSCSCSDNCFTPLKVCETQLFKFYPNDKIVLKRPPKGGEKFIVEYSARPVNDACMIDKVISTRYREAIVSGAIWMLSSLPDYFNANMVTLHGGMFSNSISRARTQVRRNFQPNDTMIRTMRTI